MNNEMLYSMFLNSIKSMSDEELNKGLEKAKALLNTDDYQKLVEVLEKEKSKSKNIPK